MKKIILTTMCMVYNNDKFLVLNRTKKDWPGLTFPGGHVEDRETIEESCIREVKEETGLEISNLEKCGYIEWNEEDARHLSILFKTNDYKGNIVSSKEGEVFFITKNELKSHPLSNDFLKILEIMER